MRLKILPAVFFVSKIMSSIFWIKLGQFYRQLYLQESWKGSAGRRSVRECSLRGAMERSGSAVSCGSVFVTGADGVLEIFPTSPRGGRQMLARGTRPSSISGAQYPSWHRSEDSRTAGRRKRRKRWGTKTQRLWASKPAASCRLSVAPWVENYHVW